MADFLGSYNTSVTRTHVRFQFTTHAQTGAAVAPSTAFENADLRIYKATDGAGFSATQRASANGITMTSPFDSVTGLHDVDIDLTDNSDASFYVAGFYCIVLTPDETVDSLAVVKVLAYFEIGPPPVNVTQLGGVVQSLTDLKDFADTGYDPSTHAVALLAALADDSVTGAALKTDFSAELLAAMLALANAIETGETFKQTLRAIRAGVGKLGGAGTGTEILYAPDGSTARLTYTVTIAGDRTVVTNL